MRAKRRKPLFERLKNSLEEGITAVGNRTAGRDNNITTHRELKKAVLKQADVKTEYDALETEFERLRQRHRKRHE